MAATFPTAAAATPLDFLHSAGAKADAVLPLTWAVIVISLTVVVIIGLLILGGILRAPSAPLPEPGTRVPLTRLGSGMNWITIGVGISSIALVVTVVWTMVVLAQVESPGGNPPFTIEITGHQWWWQARYITSDPSRVFTTANEIHIPTGQPVHFKLVSADVIHSFWVPALAGKTDLIPGQTNETWFEASKPGIYRGQCTEYCGVQHAHMGLVVVAQSPADFKAWWNHQLQSPKPPADPRAIAGMNDFTVHCGSCHSVRGTDAAGIYGPDLSHLMTRHTIAAGTYPNTPGYLAGWIANPQGMKPGCLMPTLELNGTELTDIRSYLETLN